MLPWSLMLAAAVQVPACAGAGVVHGRVGDAALHIPIVDAVVRSSIAQARSSATGRFALRAGACDTLQVARVGYAPARVPVRTADTLDVHLRRLAAPLEAVRVDARASGGAAYHAEAQEARALGGVSAAQLAATLPFVQARSTSGRTAFSLRGSRAEQVVVLLDGVPLNDPATGSADPSDIPLAAIGAAAVAPGSAVSTYGSGAAGGVIAFNSAQQTVLAASAGSLGRRSAEAAWTFRRAPGRMRVGGAVSTLRDDFRFRNVAAAPPADTLEQRVNNDTHRMSIFASALLERAQLLVLHTRVERGLVGPMNIRAFDRDRGRTVRTLARGATTLRGVELQGAARLLQVAYENASIPQSSFTVRASSVDTDAAWSMGPVALRTGVGSDIVSGSTLPHRARGRGFAVATGHRGVGSFAATLTVRGDVVEGVRGQLTPSLLLHRAGRIALTARAAQGFRVPTFYDLYVASPQRVTAGVLRPERVTHDLEVGAATRRTCGHDCAARAELSLFERRTRDAIVWFPGNVGWSPQNVPVERARGAELHMGVSRTGVELTTWGGRYATHLWDGFLEMRTPYVPYWSAGASAVANAGPVSGRLQVRHTGRRPFVNGPAIAELELPGATVATAGLQFTNMTSLGRVTTSLSADDLTDVRAESVRRYPTAGRTWALGFTIEP